MKNNAIRTSRHLHTLFRWAAPAYGIIVLGISPTALIGAESHRHRESGLRASAVQPVSSEHQQTADTESQPFGPTSFHDADTAGLWDGYQHGDCHNCQPIPPAGGTSACGCNHCGGNSSNPVYRVLDGIAGGIERVMRLDRRGRKCDESTCDDGCDAVMLEELRQMDGHAVPMVNAYQPAPLGSKEAGSSEGSTEADVRKVPGAPQPTRKPLAPQRRKLPAPVLPDAKVDPFADEAAWTQGRNPAIKRSAYFE